jgi:cell division protease FtsH
MLQQALLKGGAMNNDTKNDLPDEREQKQQAIKIPFWRLLIWAVVIAVFLRIASGGYETGEKLTIPYSELKEQIKNGNVKDLTFKGDALKGKFNTGVKQKKPNSKDSVTFGQFSSTKPSMEDQNLFNLLDEKGVTYQAESAEGSSWWVSLLILAFPWLILLGYLFYAGRNFANQVKGSGGGIFGIGKSRAKRFRRETVTSKYCDVAGLSNAKKDLQEIVAYLKDPDKFTNLGATIPKGVLLMGPPGTGKTLLARATAGEAGVPFFSTSGSEFVEMFVGVGASRVRDMFETAKKEAPAIIFIDELDSIGRTRGTGLGGSHDEREQTLNQILSEMDGFEPHESVVVIAATNRPDVLDPALIRPGRFDRQITLEEPQKNARIEILRIHAANVPLDESVKFERIAAKTVGFSGAELRNLVNEAALLAGRKGKLKVDNKDFEEAQDKILLGAEREDKLDEKEKQIVAYHEAGHALIAKLLPETDPLQKVTIIARGRALGSTEQIPEADRHNLSKKYLLARITVALGGRASEKLIYGELTNGASEDLKHITMVARKMVCQWGMSDRLGPTTFNQAEEHPFLGRELAQPRDFSEATARVIDEEVQRIILEQESRAIEMLMFNKQKLELLAAALMEFETLDNNDVDRILNGSGIDGATFEPQKKAA